MYQIGYISYSFRTHPIGRCVRHLLSFDACHAEVRILKKKRMYLDACAVRETLSRSLPVLLEILADLFHRYSQEDQSLQQPPRSVLSVNESEKYERNELFRMFEIFHMLIFSCLLNKPCIDIRRGYMCVKTITVFPNSSPAIDGNVSLFDCNTGRLCLVRNRQ